MFNSQPARERDPEARRSRLLVAATQVFAKDGFEKASLRQICLKARVNLAAVKYYFGNKEELYREVLLDTHRKALEHETPVRLTEGENPEDTLRRWIYFCLRFMLLKRASNPVTGHLMSHELRQPTPCLNDFVRLVVRPFHQDLHQIVAAVMNQSEVTEEIITVSHHIVGLCVHYDHGRAVMERLGQPVPKTDTDICRLAESVADFVLFGLCGLRDRKAAVVTA